MIYNTFPYRYNDAYEKEISGLVESILTARDNHKEIPYNVMYEKKHMPDDLRKYHEENDRLFMKLYDLPDDLSDEEVARELLFQYKKYLNPSM